MHGILRRRLGRKRAKEDGTDRGVIELFKVVPIFSKG